MASRKRREGESYDEYRASLRLEQDEVDVALNGYWVWSSDLGSAFKNPNQEESFYLSEEELVKRAEAWKYGKS